MTAIKLFRKLLPIEGDRDAPKLKRRKPSVCDERMIGHAMPIRKDDALCDALCIAPNLLVSRALADRGFPDRLDPLSIDHLMEFDYDDGNNLSNIPSEIVFACETDILGPFHGYSGSKDLLYSARNSTGETLLHLACKFGSVSTLRFLFSTTQVPTMVLDKHGHSPLHSLCIAMASCDKTRLPTSKHIESMRVLLRQNPMLLVFKDKRGKVPLEYLPRLSNARTSTNPLACLDDWKVVNELLLCDNVVEKTVADLSCRMEVLRSGRNISVFEKINSMIDASGIQSAILETGLSI